jgi:putative component of toxin-antitoxin plasmid stabilization module
MRLKVIFAADWTVMAPVDTRGRCRVMEDLYALKRTDSTARAQLTALLERVACDTPQRDPQRSRHVGGGVYEFKTLQGWRLFYFVDRDRVIICTELCRKPKRRELRAIVRRAQAVRARYLEARSAGTIVMEDDSCQV